MWRGRALVIAFALLPAAWCAVGAPPSPTAAGAQNVHRQVSGPVVRVAARARFASSAEPGWTDRLNIVEGPVAAPLSRDVLTVTYDQGNLTLYSISARNGARLWTVPVTMSVIPPGTPAPPPVIGAITLALVSGSPKVDNGFGAGVEAIDTASGRKVWSLKGTFVVLDPPTVCPGPGGAGYFCLVLSESPTSKVVLATIDATTGKIESEISDVTHRLADGLYESGGSSPNLVRVSFPTGVLWSKPLDALLASRAYDLDYGWSIDRIGTDYLVSVRARPDGATAQLSTALTAAVDAATGTVRWRVPGSYRCEGALPISAPYVCDETGTVRGASGTSKPTLSRGASVALVGVDPGSGRTRWRFRVGDVQRFLLGTGYALSSGATVVVHGTDGNAHSVNLTTGRLLPVPLSAVLWCPSLDQFGEVYPNGHVTQRVGATNWSVCDAEGDPVRGSPAVTTAVGVVTGQHFVVASSSALTGRSLSVHAGTSPKLG